MFTAFLSFTIPIHYEWWVSSQILPSNYVFRERFIGQDNVWDSFNQETVFKILFMLINSAKNSFFFLIQMRNLSGNKKVRPSRKTFELIQIFATIRKSWCKASDYVYRKMCFTLIKFFVKIIHWLLMILNLILVFQQWAYIVSRALH